MGRVVGNLVAQHLCCQFGFEAEGLFEAYALRDGVNVDAVSMACLHPLPPIAAGQVNLL